MNNSKTPFIIQKPMVDQGAAIERESLAAVEREAASFPRFSSFNPAEREVVKRLIHATTCFKEVIERIHFTASAIEKIQSLLTGGATIITDTTMIQSGISHSYTGKYSNQVVCHVSRSDVIEDAVAMKVTRSQLAVQRAIEENLNRPILLACGNAPTFLYSAIETLIRNQFDPEQIALIAFPVGFINVVEAKAYALGFMDHFGVEGIVMRDRFGSSPMVVSAIHAIYKLIQ